MAIAFTVGEATYRLNVTPLRVPAGRCLGCDALADRMVKLASGVCSWHTWSCPAHVDEAAARAFELAAATFREEGVEVWHARP